MPEIARGFVFAGRFNHHSDRSKLNPDCGLIQSMRTGAKPSGFVSPNAGPYTYICEAEYQVCLPIEEISNSSGTRGLETLPFSTLLHHLLIR